MIKKVWLVLHLMQVLLLRYEAFFLWLCVAGILHVFWRNYKVEIITALKKWTTVLKYAVIQFLMDWGVAILLLLFLISIGLLLWNNH